jgi:AraC-like DNA-binding protein
LAQRDVGGFALSLGAHRPRETIPAHRHEDEYQWCLTLEGGFEETSGRRREDCGAGSLLVRPPDCVHADRFTAARGLCLNLFPRAAWLAAQGFEPLADTHLHLRTQRLKRLGAELAAELGQGDTAANLAIESLVLELLTSAVRLRTLERQGRPRWLAATLDEIEADPTREHRLSALAHGAGVSTAHLARTFRSAFGRTIGVHVRERRLAHAANLMRDNERTLADIAAAVGFYDQAHFTRAFKARFGATPAAYRKAN